MYLAMQHTILEYADEEIAEELVKAVDDFLSQFTIGSESSNCEHLDIILFLKAVPGRITESNLSQC